MRYIDLDKAIKVACEFVGKLTHNQIDAVDMAIALEEKSTEDVVPRAEVEKAKQEVAKSMIDEFEFNIECLHECAKATGNIMFYWETLETELKKKYIGEKQ